MGTPDSRRRAELTSFGPHRGTTQQPRNSYRKPTRHVERQAVREQRPLDPPTLRATPQRHPRLNQADLCDALGMAVDVERVADSIESLISASRIVDIDLINGSLEPVATLITQARLVTGLCDEFDPLDDSDALLRELRRRRGIA